MSLKIYPTPATGNVTGPASATDGHLAVFDGTTGKLIKDGGAVPGGISGLTTNTLPKATSATTIADSRITDNGTTSIAAVGDSGTAIGLTAGANQIVVAGEDTDNIVQLRAPTIDIDSGAGITNIGDVGSTGNGTTLTVNDSGNTINLNGSINANGQLSTSDVVPIDSASHTIGSVAAGGYTDLYLEGDQSGLLRITGNPTVDRIVTFPDASGTVQLVGAANTGCVLTCLSNNTVLSTATGQVFTSPGNDGTPLTVTSEGAVGWVVTRAGTIRNLYIRSGTTAKVNTPATAVVVRKNGADTALTVAAITQTTTTTSSDVAHSFAVVAGDVITVSLTTTGVAGVSVSIASLTFELD